MKKKQAKKAQTAKMEEGIEEEQDDEDHTPTRRGRQDNSLSVLTKKFIQLIKNSQNCTIDLNQAVQLLGVQKRRIYDITNVLQGINYVQKLQKNTIKWIGGNEDPQIQRQIMDMRKKLEELDTEQKRIDLDIASINTQIKQQYLDREQLRKYHYITHEDCVNICKSMNKNDPSKSMIIISAPRGSSLEVGEEERGECVLKMDANGKDRPIKVYTCKPNEGVVEINVNKS